MTTERIDIVIREDGSRVVKRNLENLDPAARKAASGVDFLKRSLVALGGAFAARELLTLINTYQNLQNRLRSTGLEAAGLSAVYKELLQVSNDTRSSVEGSVELYARLATSSKELGVSQRQLIDFTKSLNQAIILSGASANEAQAGLIQLSQGLASGTLRGDELRSVLEQLPAVADVIAKKLGVTRGELRKMGEDGKITAQTVLGAFQSARQELEERFAKTIPTLSQSFQILKNNVLTFVGELDNTIGFSTLLSRAMMLLANNLDTVADAVVRLGKALAVAAVSYATFMAANKTSALIASAKAALDLSKAIAAGSVVMLGSAEATRQQAAAAVATATADNTATLAAVGLTRATAAQALASEKAVQATAAETVATARAAAGYAAAAADRIRWTQSQLVAERELELVRMKAQISDIGRAQSATRLAGIRKTEQTLLVSLTAAELRAAEASSGIAAAQAAQAAQLQKASAATLAARGAVTAAEKTALASTTALTAATTAAAAASAKAAGSTTLLGQAFAALGGAARAAWAAISSLFVLVAANPFAALLIAITAVVGYLVVFADKIKLGVDSMTTFQDLLRAVGEVAQNSFNKLLDSARAALGPVAEEFLAWWKTVDVSLIGILKAAASAVDFFVKLWRGAVASTVAIFEGVPPALQDIFTRALNHVLERIGAFVNKAGDLLSTVTEFAGLGKIASNLDFTLDNKNAGAAARLGGDVAAAFKQGFQEQGPATKFLDDVVSRAQEFAQARAEIDRLAKLHPNKVSDVSPGPAAKLPIDGKELDKARNALQSLLSTIKPSVAAVQDLADAEKVLDNAVKFGLISRSKANEYLDIARKYYEDLINPLGRINREMDQQTELLKLNADQRDVEGQLLQITQQLQDQGITLTQKETQSLRDKITAIQELNRIVQAQDEIYAQSIGKRKAFEAQLVALQNMMANPEFTTGDAAAQTESLLSSMGLDVQGTQIAIDAQVAAFETMYAQIDALRQRNLISEQDAMMLQSRVAVEQQQTRFKSTQDFFGSLATLQSSSNKKIAAIGKAAAITQATIDGVLAVQKALASAPPPYNYALAAAVGVAAAANVAKIAGFEEGGYTGNGGKSDIAGVVHGREFVVNAEGTRRNRAALEAMNSGAVVGQGGGGEKVRVIVNNNAPGTRATAEERQTPNGREIEVKIAEVVARDVRRGGPISNTMESQYGLNRTAGTVR